MRAAAVLAFLVIALPGLARGQARDHGIDVSPAIPVHPSVATILQFPDAIEHAQIQHRGDFMLAGAGNELAVRPHPDTPAGVERLLEVKTRTMHRMFRLRVVERAEDATRELVIRGADAAERTEDARQETLPAAPEPAASAPPSLPRAPDAGPASTPERAEPLAAHAQGFEMELSVPNRDSPTQSEWRVEGLYTGRVVDAPPLRAAP